MDIILTWARVAGCSALRSEVDGCSALLQLLAAAAACAALPQLLEAAEDMKRCMLGTRSSCARALSVAKQIAGVWSTLLELRRLASTTAGRSSELKNFQRAPCQSLAS